MNREDLQQTLAGLRRELNALGPDAGLVKERVGNLIDDLERQIQEPVSPEGNATMRERLAKLIEQSEAKHPTITRLLDQVVTSLAGIGI